MRLIAGDWLMYIVVGGTGHVGSAVAKTLLDEGEAVTIVTRDREKAGAWQRRGAEVAVADVHDVASLREVFCRGQRAFLLNPNADISSDTDQEERETVRCLLEAIEGSGLEKVVAQSTLGAQPGKECGDLNVLYELESGPEEPADFYQCHPRSLLLQQLGYDVGVCHEGRGAINHAPCRPQAPDGRAGGSGKGGRAAPAGADRTDRRIPRRGAGTELPQ